MFEYGIDSCYEGVWFWRNRFGKMFSETGSLKADATIHRPECLNKIVTWAETASVARRN